MIIGILSNAMSTERRDEYPRDPKLVSRPDEGLSLNDFHTLVQSHFEYSKLLA